MGDAAGRRIVPQVRRQVPESWRRVLPVPLAAGLYGVLLGLGFTTFVLSFAVYALAAVSLALGEPLLGAVVGLAFAAGRILPVVVLAPLQGSERGIELAAAMAERPGILRAIRAAGALALTGAAIALALGGAPASAASAASAETARLTDNGTDPSATATAVAWQLPRGGASMILRAGAAPETLPGSDPALGPDNVVWREGETLVVADQLTLRERLRVDGARRRGAGRLRALARLARARRRRRRPAPDRPAGARSAAGRSAQRARARPHRAPVDRRPPARLPRDRRRTRARSRRSSCRRAGARSCAEGRNGALLLNPSEQGGTLLYVRSSYQRQQVLTGPRRARDGDRDRSLLTARPTARRDAAKERGRKRHREGYPGGRAPRLPERPPEGVSVTLWSTALAPAVAYVTRIRRTDKGTTTVILSLPR